MGDMKWTPEQRQVIRTEGRDILVSAAAGSGKTAVLVERIIRKVLDPDYPQDVDRLLVVTFTRAAAHEMKERIRKAISDAYERGRGGSILTPRQLAHLERQLTLVHGAQITTIDSFCTYVVRNHFNEIDLEPDFRIAEEGEAELLSQDVLSNIVERRYASRDELFHGLVAACTKNNHEDDIIPLIRAIAKTANSYPWPMEWIASARRAYEAASVDDLKNAGWMQWMLSRIRAELNDCIRAEEQMLPLCDMQGGPPYRENLTADIEMLEDIASSASYDEMAEKFNELKFSGLSRKKSDDADLRETVKNARDKVKKHVTDLAGSFKASLDENLAMMQEIAPYANLLLDLAVEYLDEFAAKKRQKNVLDFGDLEHMALHILRDPSDPEHAPTAAAEEFRNQFAEVMVDEYQDSNYLQEAILTAVTKQSPGNMFMVGDVKQSIYAFRQARPDLFAGKLNRFEVQPTDDGGQRIDLAKNFRSRSEVLDVVNDIFYRIMQPDLGGVAYTEDAALHAGADYDVPEGESDPYACEVLLAGRSQEELDEREVEDKNELEAQLIARKIRQVMGTLQVRDHDSGQMRSMQYSDIVVLLRSPSSTGEAYVSQLMDAGIPAHMTATKGYFSTVEVSRMLALLSVLNNPQDDANLAAVMHSRVAGVPFSDDDMYLIRESYPDCISLWESVLAFGTWAGCSDHMNQDSQGGDTAVAEPKPGVVGLITEELRDHVVRFLTWLKARREDSTRVPIHQLIMDVMDETGYLNYVSALPGGDVRRANLMKLADQAIRFEKTSYRGLYRFMNYIEKLKSYEVDFGEAELIGDTDNAVRIMSIHKSKGLEFPVVFVSGLGNAFNLNDAKGKLVIQSEFGLSLQYFDPENHVRRRTLYQKAVGRRIREDSLGEELRVLYVAMTRAKEKLILTGTLRDPGKSLSEYAAVRVGEGEALPYLNRSGAGCYFDWILPALLSYGVKYQSAIIQPSREESDEEVLEEAERLDGLRKSIPKIIAGASDEVRGQIRDRLDYQYPYSGNERYKTKYSVSEIKHAAMDEVFGTDEAAPVFETDTVGRCVPEFIREQESRSAAAEADESHKDKEKTVTLHTEVPQGALRGTAMHRVMECYDFARDDYRTSLMEQIRSMRDAGRLTEEQYDLIIPGKIQNFLDTEIAERFHQAAVRGRLYAEKAFVMGGRPSEFFHVLPDYRGSESDDPEEMILVQGIIDAFLEEDDGYVLLDYKTDRVKGAQELIDRYEAQLLLYADAIERARATGDERAFVKEILIYSFALNEVISIPVRK